MILSRAGGHWVVTGGAGRLGSAVAAALQAASLDVTVVDDLSTGRLEDVPPGCDLVIGDVGDSHLWDHVLRGAAGVVDLTSRTAVDRTAATPMASFRACTVDLLTMADAMVRNGTPALVHASTAAVYGEHPMVRRTPRLAEDHPTVPTSLRGWAAVSAERTLSAVSRATGLAVLTLRVFEVAGGGGPGRGAGNGSMLLARAVAAHREREAVAVYGTGYPTRDGTLVRDHVHVRDVAAAHVAAVGHVVDGWRGSAVYNVGSGRPSSVCDVLRVLGEVSGSPVRTEERDPLPDEPATAVADVRAVARDLGWRPTATLQDCVRSTWEDLSCIRSRPSFLVPDPTQRVLEFTQPA